MDKFNLYAAQFLRFKEHFGAKGHKACIGCGVALAVRQAYKALEENDVNIEKSTWTIPWEQNIFLRTEDSAAKTKPSLLSIQKDGTKDGNILHLCFDNEVTEGKITPDALSKKQPAVAAASGYSYVATACPSHPFDFIQKVKNGCEANGSAFIHILCPCPVAWGINPRDTVRLGRMAVETRAFPLYEIVNGYYQITVSEPNPRPLKDYIKRQERFARWKTKDIEALQEDVNAAFHALEDKVNRSL